MTYYDKYTRFDTPQKRSALLDDECDKCGSFDNSFRFHDWCESNSIEHLHYSCYTCGYSWMGQTVEQIRDATGYFDTYSTAVGKATSTDWSDWDAYSESEYEDALPDDDYEPSLSRFY